MGRETEPRNLSQERRSVESKIEIGAILVVIAWLLGLASGYELPVVLHALGATAAMALIARVVRGLGK